MKLAGVAGVVCLLIAPLVLGQSESAREPNFPPAQAEERLYYRDGSGNYEYECVAPGMVGISRFGRSAGTSGPPLPSGTVTTLTSIAVSSNVATANITAHGLRVGARVTVLGATVDADLNGTFTVASVPGANSFTFATANVSDGTYTESTLVLRTYAPRSSAGVWSVKKRFYTGTSIDREVWAWGSAAMDKACDSRATYWQ